MVFKNEKNISAQVWVFNWMIHGLKSLLYVRYVPCRKYS